MSDNKEESFEVPDKKEPTVDELKQRIVTLTNLNNSLLNVLQGVVITIDKIARQQSTNLGTITNQLETFINTFQNQGKQPQQPS